MSDSNDAFGDGHGFRRTWTKPVSVSVSFEQLISYRPTLSFQLAFEQPTLRDMVFDYYCGKYKDESLANAATKDYLDAIFKKYEGK